MAPKLPFRLAPEVQQLLRPHTPDEARRHRNRILVDGPRKHSLTVAILPKNDRVLMDGHHTLAVCQENAIALPEIKSVKLPDMASVLEWVEDNQAARRNSSAEELAKAREARIERVAEARAAGESTRTIAEAEGISQTQVQRDLAAAGEPGGSTDPKTVTGKDGKTYQGKKLCECCSRVGPVKGCPNCKTARGKGSAKGKGKANSKSGQVKASEKAAHEWNGRLMAEIDKADRPNWTEHRDVQKCVDKTSIAIKTFFARLTKESTNGKA